MDLSVPTFIIFGHYETRGAFFGVDIWHSGEFIKNISNLFIPIGTYINKILY